MTFVVDPKSISFSQVMQDLDSYLDSKPDALKWKDFFKSGAGETFKELVAGLGVYVSWHVITNRRETYLQHAVNRSSNIAIAEMLGYSVFRGTNKHLRLTVTPDSTVLLPKYSIIGSVKDIDVILLNDSSLVDGVQSTVDVVIGIFKEESKTISSNAMNTFRFTSENVSSDLRLLLNDVELPVSARILDLNEDKYVTLSNAVSGIDVMYLNTGSYKYNTNDVLKLEFVKVNDLSFDSDDLSLLYGVIDSYLELSGYVVEESKTNIKINAPLAHETQYVVRGRNDYEKIFKLLDSSNLVSTNGKDVSPAIIELTYVKNDLSLYTTAEKESFVSQLEDSRPFGVQPPSISDPIQVNLDMKVVITLSDSNTLFSNIAADVGVIVDTYEKSLGKIMDFDLIEASIESLSYVRVARISITAIEWQPGYSYVRGKYVNPTASSVNVGIDTYYEAVVGGVSDSVEPIWPTVVGDSVVDGSVTWTCRDKDGSPADIAWNEYFSIPESITVN